MTHAIAKRQVDLSTIVQPSFHSTCVYNNYPKAKSHSTPTPPPRVAAGHPHKCPLSSAQLNNSLSMLGTLLSSLRMRRRWWRKSALTSVILCAYVDTCDGFIICLSRTERTFLHSGPFLVDTKTVTLTTCRSFKVVQGQNVMVPLNPPPPHIWLHIRV